MERVSSEAEHLLLILPKYTCDRVLYIVGMKLWGHSTSKRHATCGAEAYQQKAVRKDTANERSVFDSLSSGCVLQIAFKAQGNLCSQVIASPNFMTHPIAHAAFILIGIRTPRSRKIILIRPDELWKDIEE